MSEKIEQWLAAHARPPQEINLGLERLHTMRERLSLHLSMPVVTVGGTNGKGSVCHLLSAMLTASGLSVGCYTSPHILHFGERIAINGAATPDGEVLDALQTVAAAAEGIDLTYFELTTLAAALLFARRACDVVILEVGLGGRLDAVNVFDSEVAVLTNIGIDHTEFLGDTRDAIALEKAGICRAGKPVVVGDAAPPPALLPELKRREARIKIIGEDFQFTNEKFWSYRGAKHRLANLPSPALAGAHQRRNAATALAALEALPADYWPGAGAVRRGLHAVELAGRAQVLAGQPVTVLDVGHNVSAAVVLERQLFDMGYYPSTVAVLGMLARKDVAGFVATLLPRVDHWHVARPQGGDLSAEELAAAVRAAGGVVTSHPSIAVAAAAACEKAGNNGRIVVTGSFLTVADYLQHYGKES